MEESATPSVNIFFAFVKWESWCQSSVLIVTLRGSKVCLNFITFTSFSHPPSFRSYYFTVIHLLDWLRMHNENSFGVSLLTIQAGFFLTVCLIWTLYMQRYHFYLTISQFTSPRHVLTRDPWDASPQGENVELSWIQEIITGLHRCQKCWASIYKCITKPICHLKETCL